MRKRRQLGLFANDPAHKPGRLNHGGEHVFKRERKRKLERPLDSRKPLHLVLKSSAAKGKMSFLTHKVAVDRIIVRNAKKFGVRIHDRVNVGNHLHLVLSFPSREAFQRFLKTVTGLIARHITGARKGKPFGRRFWDYTAFTRVIVGHRAYLSARNYVEKNRIEAVFGRVARKVVEEFEYAVRLSRKRKRAISEFLQSTA